MAERKYVNRKKLDITAGKLPGSFRVVRDSTSDHSRIMDMLRKQANIKKSFTEGFSREDVIDALVEGIISGTIKAPFKVAASLTGADIPIEMYKAIKAIGGAI